MDYASKSTVEQLELLRQNCRARADAITEKNGRLTPEAHSLMEIADMASCLIRDINVHNRHFPEG